MTKQLDEQKAAWIDAVQQVRLGFERENDSTIPPVDEIERSDIMVTR